MPLSVAMLASDLPHGLNGSLEGVARELNLLQSQILRMQDLCRAPDPGAAFDTVVIRELQGLDLVAQRLEALSGFVLAVADATPFDAAINVTEALEAITLRDLAERLAAQASGQDHPDQSGSTAGDFDLF